MIKVTFHPFYALAIDTAQMENKIVSYEIR